MDPAFAAISQPAPPAPLDPQIQEFLRRMASEGAKYPRRDTVSIAEGREIAERVRAQWTAGGPVMAKTEDLMAPTRHGEVELRVYTPARRKLSGALLYIHGGGFVLFSINTHDRVMREYADRAGMVVIGINYTRAPEGKFPHSLDECVDTVQWLRANAARFGFEAGQLFVGGDSAGALLSVGVSITFRDAGLPPVAGMVLNYGGYAFGTDTFIHSPAWLKYGAGEYGLSIHMSMWFRSLYIDASRTDPRLAPIEARLEGLPPSFLVIDECDPLYDDNILMIERLQAAGCSVSSKVYPGTVHSFLEAVSIADIAVEAFEDTARWLDQHSRSS
ncbi:alpha/beta hydrolase fold domain-containing protein [Bradyrhizobium sp.]|uniref:alpha/beta hydrolase fold domain-containing protein n=1 Tax=Bradyrhizobium sp. TaxID=376 RepID=UPI0039E60931